jgi:hypothetical protein
MKATMFVFCLGLLLAGVAPAQDSLNCRFIGNWPFGGVAAVALDSARNLAFVGSGGGIYVLDVSVPASPVKLSEIGARGEVYGLCYLDSILYAGDGPAGLRVISVADPAHPAEVGYCSTPGTAWGVAVSGDYAYVADDRAGLQIYQFYGGGIEETSNAEVRTALPMPTVVRGVLFLSEASSRKPQATSLLDNSGRKVLDLHPGANDVRALAPGVYFVGEAQAQAQQQAIRKVIKLK